MGIYSHLSLAELYAKRDQLLTQLEDAASGIASVSVQGRNVAYHQNLSETRRLLDAVQAAIAAKEGRPTRRPIYLV